MTCAIMAGASMSASLILVCIRSEKTTIHFRCLNKNHSFQFSGTSDGL